MTVHHRTTDAPLDPARALAITTMISHINALLDATADNSRFAVTSILTQIENAYPQSVHSYGQDLSLTLYGVHVTAHASTTALLRKWQQSARLRLETGVR
ncbi:MAG: hypothetical protein ACK4MS_10530 [Paracoccaceae bacterium]